MMFEIAWEVTDEDDYYSHSVIKFTQTHQAALDYGALELGSESECCFVKRAPKFDKYAPLGYVPPEVLIVDLGWEYECWHCERKVLWHGAFVTEDDDYEYEPVKPVFVGKAVYCSQECRDARAARLKAEKQLKAKIAAFLVNKIPGITDVCVLLSEGWQIARFRIPGSQYTIEWCSNDPSHVTVSPVDAEAWMEFSSAIKAARAAEAEVERSIPYILEGDR